MDHAKDTPYGLSANAEPPNTQQHLDTYERLTAENKHRAASLFYALHQRQIQNQMNAREAPAGLQRHAIQQPDERPLSTPHLDQFRQLTDAGKSNAARFYSAMHSHSLSKEREAADAFNARAHGRE
jgi:hypothetical protein